MNNVCSRMNSYPMFGQSNLRGESNASVKLIILSTYQNYKRK